MKTMDVNSAAIITEPKGEGVDERSKRAARRALRIPPAHGENADPGQGEGAESEELDVSYGLDRAWRAEDLEQVLRAGPAEQHPHQIKADRSRIRSDDIAQVEASDQPAARIGEEHVQEENRRQQVERDSDRERHIGGRPVKRRQEVDEAGSDHRSPKRLSGRRHQATDRRR